jgi:hypothetical protein
MTPQASKHCSDHNGFRKGCKPCARAYAAVYRAENKEVVSARNKKCYQNKRDKYLANTVAWQSKNADKLKIYRREYTRRKAHSDPLFRLKRNLRVRLCTALRLNYKSGSAVRDLGCSIDEFKTYTESLFQPGMSWDNYGDWEFDHKIPLSSFDLSNREELLKAVHFSNLQPLWKRANRQKSDNIS